MTINNEYNKNEEKQSKVFYSYKSGGYALNGNKNALKFDIERYFSRLSSLAGTMIAYKNSNVIKLIFIWEAPLTMAMIMWMCMMSVDGSASISSLSSNEGNGSLQTVLAKVETNDPKEAAYKLVDNDDEDEDGVSKSEDCIKGLKSSEPLLSALLQKQLIQQFAGIYKQIPRVTYFTCQLPMLDMEYDREQRQQLKRLYFEKNFQMLRCMNDASFADLERDVFVRLVLMDRMENKQTGGSGGGRRGQPRRRAGSTTNRKRLSGGDWLDSVLMYEELRHIAIVDLACGEYSRRLLRKASTKLLFNAKFHWLLIEDYALIPTEYGIPVTVLKNESNHETDNTNGNNNRVAAEPTSSFEVADADNMDEPIENFMTKLNFYVNTELMLAKRNVDKDGDASYTLYDVWNPGLEYGGVLNISSVGSFSLTQGFILFDWFRKKSTLLRRMDMQMASIRVMNVVTNKNMTGTLEHYLTTPYDIHIDSMNRFNFNLLLAVRDMFNMSFVLMRTTSWGYLKNGKFDGMISALIKKQVDLAGSPIFYWPERHKFIDAAARTWTSRPCFIFRHPRSTKKDRIVFLQPFSNDVWILLVFCGIFTVLVLWMLTSIEMNLLPDTGASLITAKGGARQHKIATVPIKEHKIKKCEFVKKSNLKSVPSTEEPPSVPIKRGLFRRCCLHILKILPWQLLKKSRKRGGLFFESVLFYMGIICQQGLGFSTNFFSGRCIVITSLLFSFCIYQFYSASIVGTLLMEKSKTIRELKDLVRSSLQVGVEDILYNRDYFLRTKDPIALELYAKKITSIGSNQEEDPEPTVPPAAVLTAEEAKSYREILHSHEVGAHAKSAEASNWLDPESGMRRVKKGHFAFHIDVATAYKIIGETFDEREICDLTEISLFPPQKTVSIMQKNSPLRKVVAYGLRRVNEAGIMNYQIKVWHSRKPACVKKLETSDLHVDMETVSSALLVLILGYVLSIMILGIEILHYKMGQRAAQKIQLGLYN